MNTAGRRALMGGGVFATLAAGVVIGLAVTNGSADQQSPTVETTATTVVQVQATETLPPTTVPAPVAPVAPAPVVSTELSVTSAAPIVEPVTTTPTPEPTVATPQPRQSAPNVQPLVTTDANGPLPAPFVPIPPSYEPGAAASLNVTG